MRGFKWLGPEVRNTSTKTAWECHMGHQWEATYGNVKGRNSGCPHCAGKAPKTQNDYHALAKNNAIEWLGPMVSSVLKKTRWRCQLGHEWETKYASIQQGYGCPYCAQTVKKNKNDYIAVAKERGFRWIGPVVLNTHTPTAWECQEGHQWKATYANIKHRSSDCPFCKSHAPKTKKDYFRLAEERNISWLGSELPPSVHSATLWECPKGHQWKGYFSNIQAGQSCPTCSYEYRASILSHSPIDYTELAKERGFKWIGPEVGNSKSKTKWQCPNEHVWEATYNTILRGRGCPHCLDMVNSQLVSKVQRDLQAIIGGELNYPFKNFFIDIAIFKNKIKIAVEYDAWYWHAGREDFDAQRDKIMMQAGWHILRVKSNSKLPTTAELDKAFDELLSGKKYYEIILDDWGIGETKF